MSLIFFANGVLNNYLFLTIRYVLNKMKVALLRAAGKIIVYNVAAGSVHVNEGLDPVII